MGFIEAVRTCFSKYVDFQGRARRSEYWFWVLFVIIGYVIAVSIDLMVFGPVSSDGLTFGVITSLFWLAILLPNLAVTIRRLHDSGKSGWWILISLVPLVGGIVLLIFTLMPSEAGANKYGPNPITGAANPEVFS